MLYIAGARGQGDQIWKYIDVEAKNKTGQFLLIFLLLPLVFHAHSPQREGVIVSALDIIQYTFRIRSCSEFARHLSCLLCRIILVSSNVSPAASAGLFLFHQTSLYVFSSVLQSLLILHVFLYPLYHKSLFTPWCLHVIYVFMLISVKKCLIQIIFG